jgi:hypothetical protein
MSASELADYCLTGVQFVRARVPLHFSSNWLNIPTLPLWQPYSFPFPSLLSAPSTRKLTYVFQWRTVACRSSTDVFWLPIRRMYISCCSHLQLRASVKRFVSLQFLDPRQSFRPTQCRYLHRTTQTQNTRRQISMPLVGFEPTIPAFFRRRDHYDRRWEDVVEKNRELKRYPQANG